MIRDRFPSTLFLTALTSIPASAAVTLASPFTNHEVLQRTIPVPVWGIGDAGEIMTVTSQGVSVRAVTDIDGKWQAVLEPLPVGGPYELTVVGSSTIVRKDVLADEVWLRSGQSSMGFVVKGANDGAVEIAASKYPRMRLFQVKRTAMSGPTARIATWPDETAA